MISKYIEYILNYGDNKEIYDELSLKSIQEIEIVVDISKLNAESILAELHHHNRFFHEWGDDVANSLYHKNKKLLNKLVLRDITFDDFKQLIREKKLKRIVK